MAMASASYAPEVGGVSDWPKGITIFTNVLNGEMPNE
jgi:hypothetical protein